MTEVTRAHPRRQNQVAVRDPDVLAIRVAKENAPVGLAHACYFSKKHGCICLCPHNAADGGADLPRRKNRSRHLVEKRLKQVVIGAVKSE